MNKLPQIVINIGLISLTVVAVMYAQARGNVILMVAFAIVPILLIVAPKAALLGQMAILLYHSNFIVPGMPGNLLFYDLIILSFAVITAAHQIVSKHMHSLVPARRWLICFAVIVVVTIYVRGFGLHAFGGRQIGGMPYVRVFIAMAFYFFSFGLIMSEKQWKFALIGMVLISLLPVLAYTVVLASGGRLYHPLYVFRITFALRDAFTGVTRDIDTARLTYLMQLLVLSLLPVLTYPLRRKRLWLHICVLVISALGVMLSGVRGEMIRLSMLLCAFGIIFSRRQKGGILIVATMVILGMVALYMLAEQLPFGIQRVIANLPGIKVRQEAIIVADATIEWRRALWTLAWEELPKYLIVGRGFAFDADYMFMVMRNSVWDRVMLSVVTGDLHFGAYSVLYVFGIPGLLSLSAFVIVALAAHVRARKRVWNSVQLKHYHAVLLIYFCVNLIMYVFTRQAGTIIPPILFELAILNGLLISDYRLSEGTVNGKKSGLDSYSRVHNRLSPGNPKTSEPLRLSPRARAGNSGSISKETDR